MVGRQIDILQARVRFSVPPLIQFDSKQAYIDFIASTDGHFDKLTIATEMGSRNS